MIRIQLMEVCTSDWNLQVNQFWKFMFTRAHSSILHEYQRVLLHSLCRDDTGCFIYSIHWYRSKIAKKAKRDGISEHKYEMQQCSQ